MKDIKRNLLIVLIAFLAMSFLGIYYKLTHVPIQNPTNDVDLRVEGVTLSIWFTFTFIFNIFLLFFLTTITFVIKLVKNKKALVNE